MHPLVYHSGQLEVQSEANTRHVADRLAGWVGPVGEYATEADLVLLVRSEAGPGGNALRFTALAGDRPLLTISGESRLGVVDELRARLGGLEDGESVGGLAISFARAARARVHGCVRRTDSALEIEVEEAFTLCRKYIAPSEQSRLGRSAGPAASEPLSPEDPWASAVLDSAETAFLASISPDGAPDIAHRGGPAGFLRYDPAGRRLAWTEFVGDGVFKSAGNVRATGTVAVLVPDLSSGDALEIQGHATYANTLTRFKPRVDPLVRLPEPFPAQGQMEVAVDSITRLRALMHPRRPLEIGRVTSRDSPDEQAPR